MSEKRTLPDLYDVARIRQELGVTRSAAEALMRQCPKQTVPGLRKTYVRGADLRRVLDENVQAA